MVEPFDYATSVEDARELIEEFGKVFVIRQLAKSGKNYNPTLTPTDHDFLAAIVEYSNFEVDGQRVMNTDKKALVATGPIEITTEHKFVDGAEVYDIINAKPLKPASTIVFYELQLRR